MTTIVLVHGSFGGGWVWDRVTPRLEKAGHDVFTPTLTGLGERRHLVSPHVGLDVHIRDVRGVLDHNDLLDVVLLGHSYAGMVITGTAEHCSPRIRRLVYFDGFVPSDGESCWDIVPETRSRWEEGAASIGTDWLCPPPEPGLKNADMSEEDADWVRQRTTPMPLWTHDERVQIPRNRAADLPRSFISCKLYETFQSTARQARADGFDYHELETGHSPMITAPDEVAELLLDLIGDGSP